MQKNDFVKVSYEAKIKESGQVIDQVEDLVVVVGAKYIIPGLDEALEGMNIPDKKEGEVTPDKGFGERNDKLIKLIPISEFRRHNQKPHPGMVVEADNRRGRVLSVASGRVKVDFNHPLAGKTLSFKIEAKEKVEKVEDKIMAIVKFFVRNQNIKDVKVNGKEVEIYLPPTVHPVFKKKIADDVMKYLEFEKVKFVELFEKPKK